MSGNQLPMSQNYSLDLTFITNEPGRKLIDRFCQIIKGCRYFDCLVGYFYLSGFHLFYKALENTERIRILTGIGISEDVYNYIKFAEEHLQGRSPLSHWETKQKISEIIEMELADSEDDLSIEEGIEKFIEWIKTGKLQIRAYPSRKLHAKLYIFTFGDEYCDRGRVITGSSNFTYSGLVDNLEFNVELKNRSDYEFAKQKFEELWKDAVDVSKDFVHTIKERTWLKEDISPYELYLKFLYEYFKDELSRMDEVFLKYLPEDFRRLKYQEQAVLNAKKNT